MMFHTPAFTLAFLPACLVGFYLCGRLRNPDRALGWLVACNLLFYGWWRPLHVLLLTGSVGINHIIARKIRTSRRSRICVAIGITFNLFMLSWFKYAGFLLGAVVPFLPALDIALPLAISFFTFQQIMFLVDTGRIAAADGVRPGHKEKNMGEKVYATDVAFPSPSWPGLARPPTTFLGDTSKLVGGRAKPGHDGEVNPPHLTPYPDPQVAKPTHDEPANPPDQARLLHYAAFVTFFPHLIAGPIVRPSDILPQLSAANLAKPNIHNLADGLLIFLLGLGKKLVLADMFGGFADTGFNAAAHGAELTFFEAWYATLSYALQIYFDFSGYSDMAMGLARMFNIRFPLNFDSPYQATDIAAFWRRWHISLGAFLRDYLYIPLGGNRSGPMRQTANLMATMLLAGLWHGAAWNFVVWGGLHGVFLVIRTQYRRVLPPMPAALAQTITLLAVVVAWVPFRAASLSATTTILSGLVGGNGIALPRMIVAAIPALAAIADPVAVLPYLGDARTLSFPEVSTCLLLGWLIVLTLPNVHRMTDRARHWTLTGSFAFSVQALFFAPHAAPFLYFQF